MRSLITTAIVGVIPVLAIAMLWPRLAVAEQKTSPRARAKIATDVVVGEVSDTYAKTVTTERYGKGTVEKRSLIEVQVAKVEKGGLKARDVLYVRVWRIESIPSREKPMGRYGHKPIPKAGDKVRVFVVRGPYAPANQTDNGYAAVYPNGFEILTKDSR